MAAATTVADCGASDLHPKKQALLEENSKKNILFYSRLGVAMGDVGAVWLRCCSATSKSNSVARVTSLSVRNGCVLSFNTSFGTTLAVPG